MYAQILTNQQQCLNKKIVIFYIKDVDFDSKRKKLQI